MPPEEKSADPRITHEPAISGGLFYLQRRDGAAPPRRKTLMRTDARNPGASANAHGARNKAVSACTSESTKSLGELQRLRASFLARRFHLDAARAALVAEIAFKVEGAR